MSIILYSHGGSGNHGCEAIVRSTMHMIDKAELISTQIDEDIKYGLDNVVTVYEDVFSPIKRGSIEYFLTAVWNRCLHSSYFETLFSRKKFLSHIKEGDICLSVGGDNYCYEGIETFADLNRIIHQRRALTVLWGCSIEKKVLSTKVVKSLNKYDLITAREQITYDALKEVGIHNVVKVSDPAFLLETEEVPLPERFIPQKTIGINLSPLIFRYTKTALEAFEAFCYLLEEIISTTDDAVALIPHVNKRNDSDLTVLSKLYEKYKYTDRVMLINDYNCKQLKYIISQCRLLIAARTHASIAAYSTCVPTLVIGYSTKSKGIAMDLFGDSKNYVLPIEDIVCPEVLIENFRWLNINAKKIGKHLMKIMPSYKLEAWNAKDYLLQL